MSKRGQTYPLGNSTNNNVWLTYMHVRTCTYVRTYIPWLEEDVVEWCEVEAVGRLPSVVQQRKGAEEAVSQQGRYELPAQHKGAS